MNKPTYRLSVLLPVYNERKTLPELLKRIREVDVNKELIIIDDASTDGTDSFLRDEVEGRQPNVVVQYHPENRGKGASIRTAIPLARGCYSIIQDGDMEYDPQDYIPILEALEVSGAPAVYGSRFLRGTPRMKPANLLINRLLPLMVRVLYGARLTDEATCYKAFRTDILQTLPLQCRRFEFCPEVTARLLRRGHRIAEVPIRYTARTLDEGKKIRWTDGVQAIWTLVKFRFVKP